MSQAAALVIGGAGGIGQAVAADLAASGRSVIVADVDAAAVRLVAHAIGSEGGRAVAHDVDLMDASSIDELFRAIAADGFEVDVLVNAAGIALAKPIVETSVAEWSAVLAVNLGGTYLTCRAAAAAMAGRGGAIVNVASIHGLLGVPGRTAYAASKGGVIALTRALAAELGPAGISVNAVAPGPVDTAMGTRNRTDETHASWRQAAPIGRTAMVDDIVGAVGFLASDGARFVTGQILPIDGGTSSTAVMLPPTAKDSDFSTGEGRAEPPFGEPDISGAVRDQDRAADDRCGP